MNPLDWRKAAALVTQHKQEAAMADTDQLEQFVTHPDTIDDSGPLVVHYGSQVPIGASTLMSTIAHLHSSQQEDSYQEIMPGIPQSHYTLLYHLLVQDLWLRY